MSHELLPLPYAQRRKGLTGLSLGFKWIYEALDFIGDGVPLADFVAFMRRQLPDVKEGTLTAQRQILRNDLQIMATVGEQLVPTELGRRVRTERSAFAIAPRILTTFVAFDHVLNVLRASKSLRRSELLMVFKEAHPGWTTSMAPSQQLTMLQGMDVIENTDGNYRLTPTGQKWASLITWTPELPPPSQASLPHSAEEEDDDDDSEDRIEATAPTFPAVWAILANSTALRFDKTQVAALHAGLWAHPRRHFAIFAGLSGSGKTSLADAYARALAELTGPNATDRVCVVPVSPGWTDPTPLLGYTKPLSASPDYDEPPFLTLLLRADRHPTQIHVAILDEMNLSHPEQYLAPLLSAMELNRPIVIHNHEEVFDGIPPRLAHYPSNLVIIGTVNMDETTHGLSDKVLDRATTLEFWNIDLSEHPRLANTNLPSRDQLKATLIELLEILAPHRLHFGFRVVDDVVAFLERAHLDQTLSNEEALDWALYGKALPKLRGHDTPQLRVALEKAKQLAKEKKLRRCEAKLIELIEDLRVQGSTRFWR